MSAHETPGSLAEQAATWVPPWARRPTEPESARQTATGPAEPETRIAERPASELRAPIPRAEPCAPTPRTEPPDPAAPAVQVSGTGEAPADQSGSEVHGPGAVSDEDVDLQPALEAILLVVDEPVGESALAQALGRPPQRVAQALARLSAGYAADRRGFDLRRAAGGWRLYTRSEYADYVERFVVGGQPARLSQAALETLAVVAYKQPVSRGRVSAIRGVNCDGVMRTLSTRGLIESCGTEEGSGAFLYRTTALFLEKMGVDDVTQLPPLAPFLPETVEEIADVPR